MGIRTTTWDIKISEGELQPDTGCSNISVQTHKSVVCET